MRRSAWAVRCFRNLAHYSPRHDGRATARHNSDTRRIHTGDCDILDQCFTTRQFVGREVVLMPKRPRSLGRGYSDFIFRCTGGLVI